MTRIGPICLISKMSFCSTICSSFSASIRPLDSQRILDIAMMFLSLFLFLTQKFGTKRHTKRMGKVKSLRKTPNKKKNDSKGKSLKFEEKKNDFKGKSQNIEENK